MTHVLRHPMAAVVVLALLLSTVTPVLAIGSNPPEPDGPGSGAELLAGAEKLKHPTLDSSLFKIARDVRAGKQPKDAIARQAKVSRGESVAVSVDVAGDPAATVAWLNSHGAQVDNVGQRLIEAYVPVAELESLGSLSGVLAVRSMRPPFASVMSQGVALHGVPNWNTNGYTGAGVKVGVIDVGFDGIVSLVGSELPQLTARCYPTSGAVTSNAQDCDRNGVHGAAVAETVIDVAPGASLYISNPRSWLELNATVNWMISQGVTVINHSVGWGWEGPGDGTTIYADSPLGAVDRAVAGGITWVNAAGNEGLATWSGDYLDSNNDNIMEFASGGVDLNSVPAYSGQSIDLMMRWDDSWPRATSDLDLYLLDSFGNIVATSQEQQNGGSGDTPIEILSYMPSDSGYLYIAVEQFGGADPDWVQIQEFNGLPLGLSSPEYSIANPAESANPGLLAVGAASWFSPSTIEDFSSQGPTRDGRIKPDVVGIDQADTVSYGPSGFPGTSQASPHVAGLAVLVKQRFPQYSAAEVAQYLRSNASQAQAPNNVWGYGLAYLPEIVAGENPAPAISSISPATVQLGSYPLTITVNGNGFVPESVVHWNGEDRATTYVSPSQLTFEVDYRDTDVASTVEITVSSPGPGGGVSNAVTLTIDDDTPQVPNAVDYPEFLRTWQRTDEPVKQLVAQRTWMWGDGQASDAMVEAYADAPGGYRSVKYFDKSRMEVNDPNEDNTQSWYVTNGLLSKELITGQMQMGDDAFVDHGPAEVPVAGDPNDANGPTYATFTDLLDAAPAQSGSMLTQRIDRNGTVTDDPSLAQYGVTAASLVEVPGIRHQVASPFWEFMNSTGTIYANGQYLTSQLFDPWFYATGLPITEAYWATVKVNNQYVDVLMQCFERRCLTYTPGNPDGWKVEAGNVGLHYYVWRYGMMP
ncbi:MAG TPA: S8 family serine peptidase [Thermomicrobiales bacterium]|nr:S8 family serine peptidase [Thermomicrobiales bacterium]